MGRHVAVWVLAGVLGACVSDPPQLAVGDGTAGGSSSSGSETGGGSVGEADSSSTGLDVVPKGDRTLVVGYSESVQHEGSTAIDFALGLGIDFMSPPVLSWEDLETSPGVYVDGAVTDMIDAHVAFGIPVILHLSPWTSHGVPALPLMLPAQSLDDPATVAQFAALIDHVSDLVPPNFLAGIIIGSRTASWLDVDSASVSAFVGFYVATSEHIHTRFGNLVWTGFEYDAYRLVGDDAFDLFGALQASDLIVAEYSAISMNGYLRAPSSIATVINSLAATYEDSQLIVLGAGYPSSPALDSTETRQAEFVAALFEAWDQHQDRLNLVAMPWLFDPSPSSPTQADGDPTWEPYVRSVGLYTSEGPPKPAGLALEAALEARGWGE